MTMSLVTLDEETGSNDDAPVIEEEQTSVQVGGDDDKTPVDKPGKQEGERKTRKERREDKKFDFQAELRRRDAEIERMRGETEARAREIAELRGRFEERHAKDGQDQHRQKLLSLREKANQHLANAHGAQQNPQLAQRELNAYYDTLEEMNDVQAEAREAKRQSSQQQEAPAWSRIPEEVQEDIMRIYQEFPWMHTRVNARTATDLLINDMVKEGHPNNYTTFRAAATQIAATYRLGGSAAPSDAQRRRYTGVGGGEGDGGSSAPRTVKMGDHERKMAEARYPDLPAEQAHQKWAREIGAKLAQQR